MRLKNKVAIVTGAGQTPGETIGNGRATAISFAQEGARVLLVDKRPDSAEETARMIGGTSGQVSVLGADITVERDCQAITKTCVDRNGRIDILHNNVGISTCDADTVDLTAENWEQLMAVNLKGMFFTIKHVLPVMRAQQKGVIINISSTASLCTRPSMLAYKTAKAGVNAMTQNLAIENVTYGVRVNAILPGLMDTPMAIERRVSEGAVSRRTIRQERNAQVPLGRQMGTGWDVASAAVFLASDEARYITGILLPVDGGLSARIG